MKLRKQKPEPEPKPKGYLFMGDPVPPGPCGCRWEPLAFDPVSFAADVVFVREGEALPLTVAGHVHYCPRHGGGSN